MGNGRRSCIKKSYATLTDNFEYYVIDLTQHDHRRWTRLIDPPSMSPVMQTASAHVQRFDKLHYYSQSAQVSYQQCREVTNSRRFSVVRRPRRAFTSWESSIFRLDLISNPPSTAPSVDYNNCLSKTTEV